MPHDTKNNSNINTDGHYVRLCATLTLTAVIATEARIALAVSGHALAITRASVRAVLGHVLGHRCVEGQLLLVTVVVVDREEPVAGLHVFRHFPTHRGL